MKFKIDDLNISFPFVNNNIYMLILKIIYYIKKGYSFCRIIRIYESPKENF